MPGRVAAIRSLFVVAACFAALCGAANAQTRPPVEFDSLSAQTTAQLIAGIERKHPAAYYALAKRLFEEGERDEAVFWFYTGQIRYRAYIMSHYTQLQDDNALFSSLTENVGEPINAYALGDIVGLVNTIDRALAWDAANPDEFAVASMREQSRVGSWGMKSRLLRTADEIRADRAKNGLENRTK
jgi:hypothetical protein